MARQKVGSHVLSHEPDLWVKMAMAIKSEFAEEGFDTWNVWSQGDDSYNEKSALAVWRSIGTAGKIGIGSLYHEAAANGWRDNDQLRGSLTPQQEAEKQRMSAARDSATAVEEARKLRGYRAAAEASQKLIDLCTLETHYYLNAKGLPHAVGLVADNVLIVPMRNLETNQLQGVQSIEWLPEKRQWEKKMAFGMRATGLPTMRGRRRGAYSRQ